LHHFSPQSSLGREERKGTATTAQHPVKAGLFAEQSTVKSFRRHRATGEYDECSYT